MIDALFFDDWYYKSMFQWDLTILSITQLKDINKSTWSQILGVSSSKSRWWLTTLVRYSYYILSQRSRSMIDVVITLRQWIKEQGNRTTPFSQMLVELNIVFIEIMITIPCSLLCCSNYQRKDTCWWIWMQMNLMCESRRRNTKKREWEMSRMRNM